MSTCPTLSLMQHWSFPDTFSSTIPFELHSTILGAMSSSIPSAISGPFFRAGIGAIPFKIPITIYSVMSSSILGTMLGAIPSAISFVILGYFPSTNFGINPRLYLTQCQMFFRVQFLALILAQFLSKILALYLALYLPLCWMFSRINS